MSASASSVGPGDHIFLVDGSSFVFRAYFQSIRQDQKYNYRSDRLPTGAVRLFCTKLFQFVREGAAGAKPTHLAIIFDKSENSFRKELYPEYKAHRSEPPDDLLPQFPLMRDAVRAFGLTPVEQDRYEADDLIATYAREARERGADVLIVSADKDLMQLVGPGVTMYDPASGLGTASAREERRIGIDEVVAYFGVPPEKVIDVQALAGDSTDNVPGAPGIGVKTAAQLITEYGDLDQLLARAGEIKQPKRRETLTDPDVIKRVRISKELVSLRRDVQLAVPLDDLRLEEPDGKRLISFFKALEFTTLTKRAADIYGVDAYAIEPDPRLPVPGGWKGGENGPGGEDRSETPAGEAPARPWTPQDFARDSATRAVDPGIDRTRYETLENIDRLRGWIESAREFGRLALHVEGDSPDAMRAQIVGIGLSVTTGRAAYVPLGHTQAGDGTDLFEEAARAPGQLDPETALAELAPILEDESILKIGHSLKASYLLLARNGIEMRALADVQLASYVLDAGRAGHEFEDVSLAHLGHKPLRASEIAGSGRSFVGMARAPIARAAEYGAERADLALRLWLALAPRLPAERMARVYETLERPLIPVLARMERRGVTIDRVILSRLTGEFAQTMARLEAQIHELAGEVFNLGSPKQLGDILFGKMGLPGGRKTATGAWSTSASVLDDLAEQGVALAARILEWRQVSKLRSTYTEALPAYVHPQTERVHTSFALAATTTGRLSSSEPNIQNIPIRTDEGRKIRTAFVAPPGRTLISADYSQIELRLLAHIADIPQLRKAFAEGLDIHAMTASEMFGVPVKDMPSDVRRRAKAINFGIIYGISAFGLANQLGIPRDEAGAYIKRYFERFPGIRDYMEATKKACRENGYVTTLFGRRCHYPRIASSNPSERAFNERAAINAPIQGSAADIIRRAMTRIEAALDRADLHVQMLLQVHDELVFEAPEDEVERALPVIRSVMVEAPHPAVQLAVPLQVDARSARNWDEAH